MAGIGVILNPHSKKLRLKPARMERLSFIVGDKASCKQTQDLADLRRVADEFKARDIDILGIGGGDGTNHCTLTAMIGAYGEKPLPKIVFLRGGTLNTIAAAIGAYGSSERILASLLLKYHEDLPFKEASVRLMEINGQYGFIFGLGVIYRFMDAYYENGIGSPTRAANTLIHSISSALINGPFARAMFERFDANVTLDGQRWPFCNYSAIYAGSIHQLGLNFRVFYLTQTHPDYFHAIGFSLPPRGILKYVPAMYRGKPCGCPDMVECATQEMVIELDRALPYTVDGDMKEPMDRFVVRMGPHLSVLIP